MSVALSHAPLAIGGFAACDAVAPGVEQRDRQNRSTAAANRTYLDELGLTGAMRLDRRLCDA